MEKNLKTKICNTRHILTKVKHLVLVFEFMFTHNMILMAQFFLKIENFQTNIVKLIYHQLKFKNLYYTTFKLIYEFL